MKFLSWHQWGIKTRTLVISILQLTMILTVIGWSYLSRLNEIERNLQEHGNLVATTLALDSQYGVISGNMSDLERTIRRLMQANQSIYSIDILNNSRTSLLYVAYGEPSKEKTRIFDAEIRKDLIDVNTFGVNEEPHVADQFSASRSGTAGPVIGYVRVTMTPSSILADKQNRLLVGTAIALLFLLQTALLVLQIVRSLTRPLSATIEAVRRIRAGNYQTTLQVTAAGEVAELQESIIEMASSLDELKRDLEGKVRVRTEELAKARDAEIKANAERHRLIQKITTAVEEERRNIAIDIHDHLNASVIIVRLQLQRILELANQVAASIANRKDVDEETSKNLAVLGSLATTSLRHLQDLYSRSRDLVKRLRPEVIDTLGLRDAAEEMVRHYDDFHPNCRFQFRADGDFSGICSEVAISAYRLIQEALSNVVKHATASIVKVSLKIDEEKTCLRIAVADNGKGFDAEHAEPGIGLIGMRERVFGLGGRLNISSEISAGTIVQIELPLDSDGQTADSNPKCN